MKQFIRKFFAAAMLLSMTFAFSSCEGSLDDVFGTWDKPSQIPAQVFKFKDFLDKTGTLTVNFTLNDVPSSVTISTDGTTFSITSSLNPNNYAFTKINDDLMTLYITDGSDNTYGQIFFKISDGSYYIVNNIDADITFDGKVSVNGISGTVTNNCPDKAEIGLDTNGDISTFEEKLIVYYNKAKEDTWKTVIERYELTVFAEVLDLRKNYTTAYDPSIHSLADVSAYVHDGTKLGKVYADDTDNPARGDKKVGFKGDEVFAGPYQASLAVPVT